jgi:GNAT superfamily N-acetyltransferase
MLIIKAFSSSQDAFIGDFNIPFREEVDEWEEDKYTFMGSFEIIDEEKDKPVASVSGRFFNHDKIANDGEDIVDVADWINQEVYNAIFELNKSKLYKREIDDNKLLLALYSCYIDRVFVYPEYRNMRIGKYIFDNLEDLCCYCFNVTIHSFVIFPKPQIPSDGVAWVNAADPDGEVKKLMIRLLELTGFEKIGRNGFYAKIVCSIKSGIVSFP